MNNSYKKAIFHLSVWIVIFIIETLVYWKWQFWEIDNLWFAVQYNASINVVKVMGTYLAISWLIPLLSSKKPGKLISIVSFVTYLIVWLLLYRVVINYLIWPWLFGHFPGFDPFSVSLSTFSFLKMITPLPFLLMINFFFEKEKKRKTHPAIGKRKTFRRTPIFKEPTQSAFFIQYTQ